MSLDLTEIKELHDKAYNYNQTTRLNAADDTLFYRVTQWDDTLIGESNLGYKGQFDILRKAGRQIMADLRSNPVQVDFEPKDDSRKDGADLLDGLYLSDDRINTSIESYDNATGEAVVCGLGGWELHTEYESSRNGSSNQVIRRKPIYEFNNNCFMDPNAKLLDKSDMMYCSILTAYSEDGYKKLVHELTGEKVDKINVVNFKDPVISYTFPWVDIGSSPQYYVTTFYHKEKIKDTVYTITDPMGETLQLRASDLEEIMDEIIDAGYEIIEEKEIERWEVRKYIASGEMILNGDEEGEVIAGENIPVIPSYGERAMVEGEEHYEGVTRLAKDPQRLRNFVLSYMADIVSRSPRPKPIFYPEQIGKFKFMYEENGADNNYPYLLQERNDALGQPLPLGPIAQMPETPIPQSAMLLNELSRQAVEDVANPGLPQDISDADISGKAVVALQARLDQQSIVYQQNLKHAKRRDAEVYASMAVEVYDAPRQVSLTMADGSRKKVFIMESVMDTGTGDMVTLNDITNMEFDVYADIGPSYASKNEQAIEQLGTMSMAAQATDPAMAKLLMLQQITLMPGNSYDDVREYANNQLILQGIKKPDTPEQIQMLQQALSQPEQPDAAMMLAMAENKKGDAQMADTRRKAMVDMATSENNRNKTIIEMFKAQTDRAEVEVDAEQVGANIRYTNLKAAGQQIENVEKLTNPFRSRVNG